MESVKKISLWRAGFQSFERHWKEWISLALIFFFIFAFFNVAMIKFMEPLQAKMAELKGSKDPQANLTLFKDMAPQFSGFIIALALMVYVEHYLFFSFFMRKELPAESAKPTLHQFFCYISTNIQLAFALMLPVGAVAGVSVLFIKSAHIVAILGMIASVFLMTFLMVRLYFAIPLAAAKLSKPLSSSWAMTADNFWRLFGNTLLFTLIILLIYLGAMIVSLLAGLVLGLIAKLASLPVKPLIDIFFRVVLGSAFSVFMAGVISAYTSAACRIIYQERRQADPTFILTTRN